jgi:hypothetical protein
VTSVVLPHGINANVVRKWLPLYRDLQLTNLPAFVPFKLEPKLQAAPGTSVSIDVPFGQKALTVKWPATDPEGCARFVRGL